MSSCSRRIAHTFIFLFIYFRRLRGLLNTAITAVNVHPALRSAANLNGIKRFAIVCGIKQPTRLFSAGAGQEASPCDKASWKKSLRSGVFYPSLHPSIRYLLPPLSLSPISLQQRSKASVRQIHCRTWAATRALACPLMGLLPALICLKETEKIPRSLRVSLTSVQN